MMQRLVSFTLTLLMVLAMTNVSFAAAKGETIEKAIMKTEGAVYLVDLKIAKEIENAQCQAEKAMSSLTGDALTMAIDGIIAELQSTTFGQVTKIIDKAAERSILIERTWIPVVIGNQLVYVDPARCVRY